jgi:hypothetical protein
VVSLASPKPTPPPVPPSAAADKRPPRDPRREPPDLPRGHGNGKIEEVERLGLEGHVIEDDAGGPGLKFGGGRVGEREDRRRGEGRGKEACMRQRLSATTVKSTRHNNDTKWRILSSSLTREQGDAQGLWRDIEEVAQVRDEQVREVGLEHFFLLF